MIKYTFINHYDCHKPDVTEYQGETMCDVFTKISDYYMKILAEALKNINEPYSKASMMGDGDHITVHHNTNNVNL